jgi:hypothetical protein
MGLARLCLEGETSWLLLSEVLVNKGLFGGVREGLTWVVLGFAKPTKARHARLILKKNRRLIFEVYDIPETIPKSMICERKCEAIGKGKLSQCSK